VIKLGKKPPELRVIKRRKRKPLLSNSQLMINRSNLALRRYNKYFEQASKVPGLSLSAQAEIANVQKNLRNAETSFRTNADFGAGISAIELAFGRAMETALALEEKNPSLKGLFLKVKKEVK